jgi:ribonuclease E
VIEPELDVAVADFDRPPRTEPERLERAAEPPRPEAAPEAPPAPETPDQPEQPRRRSTVREPVPFFTGQGTAQPSRQPTAETQAAQQEPATPHVPDRTAEAEGDDRPRRTGWWARRFAGKS